MLQFFPRFIILACQAQGEFLQGFAQIAILIERPDQKCQCCAIFFVKSQRQRLTRQKFLQGFLLVRELGRIG